MKLKNKVKSKIYTFIICLLVSVIYLTFSSYKNIATGVRLYKVYLDGEVIGAITDKDDLYNLINERQQKIKDKYNVSNVYPPDSLQLVETYSYNTEITNLGTIYKQIENLQDFTIRAYEVGVSATDDHEAYTFYILNKDILSEAMEKFILAFIDERDYRAYIDGTQEELDDIGIYYNEMGIIEDMTIREKYVSINETIYDSSDTLAQNLLFGFNYKERIYTIKSGDTIESISEANTLNTQEFLIANPEYASKDSLLAIGDKVNITLINPELSFSYDVLETKQVVYPYNKNEERDNTKDSNYSEVKQPGITGISIQTTKYNVVNGEPNGAATMVNDISIREKVDEIIVKGKKQGYTWGTNTYDYSDTGWLWPTTTPYAVTSEYQPRWGKIHGGIDISGTGEGSKIFAANDGVVTYVWTDCPNQGKYGSSCGGGFGNHVVIKHDNNIYTLYGHMRSNIPVKVGQKVAKGTVVGYMGNSGSSTGYHLHFSFYQGDPKNGGSHFNPRKYFPIR